MDRHYQPAPDVIATPLEGEVILLDPGSGQLFSLNDSGQFVWDRLGSGTPDQIAGALCEAFEVTVERATTDVGELVLALLDAGLIVQRNG